MMKGYQVILDFCNVPYDLCNDDKHISKVLHSVASFIGADVINMSRNRFTQPADDGCTVVLTLDASHLSAHSYAREGLLAIDAFISGEKDRAKTCSQQIIEKLGLKNYIVKSEIV